VVFFGEIHVLHQLRKIVHLEQESLSAAENPQLQELLLSKTNRILTANSVLYGEDYNIHGFLRRDTGESSTQLSIPIGTKLAHVHLQ
jgi:hypothetical protein